ncbi:DUF433 domain-containing protein [Hahella sp. KA22]|uniref:DUF433 domain-containing protein n=1 Tax=Hahella sp. KA22 TaxID=1628392 RepID=UPI000FDE5814|nr:DUF433 domain-containing protein [Hahella sp. KA22]AZZ90704.1 DUF433 domain-containing protein [Hahella sp. KA22]QAY54074.1 DUF433 domain-containing protein [Hahella sp. KA22]
MSKEYLHYIETKPDVMVGKPCIKGTRITVEAILEMLACGMSHSEIISDFPSLNEAKIRAALMYAAHHIAKGSAA